MKELKKTLFVYTIINLAIFPFVYTFGFVLFGSFNWIFSEVSKLESGGQVLTFVVFGLLQSYFLYLGKNY